MSAGITSVQLVKTKNLQRSESSSLAPPQYHENVYGETINRVCYTVT